MASILFFYAYIETENFEKFIYAASRDDRYAQTDVAQIKDGELINFKGCTDDITVRRSTVSSPEQSMIDLTREVTGLMNSSKLEIELDLNEKGMPETRKSRVVEPLSMGVIKMLTNKRR